MTIAALLVALGAAKVATIFGVAAGAAGGAGLYAYLKGKVASPAPEAPKPEQK